MSDYMINKFKAGEVHIEDNVCGWLFDSGEFRPLMADAMLDLFKADLVTEAQVKATAEAHEVYQEAVIAEYINNQRNRSAEAVAEERAEARAAFGPGETVVNIFTGERYTT